MHQGATAAKIGSMKVSTAAAAAFVLSTLGTSTAELLYKHVGLQKMNQTLREAALAAGIYIGAEHNYKFMVNQSDPMYEYTLKTQFDTTVLGNGCKWQETQPLPPPAALNTTECSYSQKWSHDIMQGNVRLHNLCWGSYNPDWLKNLDGAELKQALTQHVTEMIHSVGQIPFVTDVVNEPFCQSTEQCWPAHADLKNNTWYPKLPDYVHVAFQAAGAARDAAGLGRQTPDGWPALALFVNDYGAEQADSYKSQRQVEYVKDMQAKGIPIDGVGLQMHVTVDQPRNPQEVLANLKQLAAMGLASQITEMDVRCPKCGPGAENQKEREKQAKVYGDALTACLAAKASEPGKGPGCNAFIAWGFTDRRTWLGTDQYPLPFDVDYQPKEAALELLAVLQQHAAGRPDPTRPWAWNETA